MKKLNIIVTVVILFYLFFAEFVFSKQVSKRDVQQVAKYFLSWRSTTNAIALKKQIIINIEKIEELQDPDTKDVLAYIAILKPKGFVVISSDTDLEPVIAYSFRLVWNADTSSSNVFYQILKQDMRFRKAAIPYLPYNLKNQNNLMWQKNSENQMFQTEKYLFRQWPEQGTTLTGGWVETTWHQLSPFNNFCPIDPDSSKRSVVGCVATSLAQILNYHQYIGNIFLEYNDQYITPTRGIEIDADSSLLDFPSFIELNSYLENLKYNYNNKLPLDDTDNAALCFTCGVLLQTDYTCEGSGASYNNVVKTLTDRWGYYNAEHSNAKDMFYVVLKENMMNGLPAQLFIERNYEKVGHAVIADGYNTDGFYHLNYGWRGDHPDPITDAWYRLPEQMGEGYNIVHSGIVNIMPTSDFLTEITCSDSIIYLPPSQTGKSSECKNITLYNAEQSNVIIDHIVSSNHFLISTTASNFSDSIGTLIIPSNSQLNLYVQCSPDSFGYFKGDIIASYSGEKKYVTIDCFGYGFPANATVIQEGEVAGVWSKSSSPYLICGDVLVNEGSTLNIMSGVQVVFLGSYKFDIKNNAQLIAKGAVSDSIYFCAGYPVTGWLGFYFIKSSDDDSLTYCVVRDGRDFRSPCESSLEERKGGAIYMEDSAPVIAHSRFSQNQANFFGGGAIFCDRAAPKVVYCNFIGNSGSSGGAISFFGESLAYDKQPTITHSLFRNNYADRGGAIAINSSNPIISYCWIEKNETNDGGGVYLISRASPQIDHTIFSNNMALRGGALYGRRTPAETSKPIFKNVTIYGNTASETGGALCIEDNSHFIFKNTIIWNNQAPFGSTLSFISQRNESGNVEFAYSDIDTCSANWLLPGLGTVEWLPNNLAEDPLFKDEKENNFQLQPGSSCIDAGDPMDDVGAEPFPHGFRINMGAYGGTPQAALTNTVTLTVAPERLDFGIIRADITKEMTLYLKNGSPGIIHITQVSCSDSIYFSILNFPVQGIALKPGYIHSINVRFSSNQMIEQIIPAKIIIKSLECSDKIIDLYAHTLWGTQVMGGSICGIWEKVRSPYNVCGDLHIPSSEALIIEPGVTIQFAGQYRITVGENAQLRAIGSAADSIRFCAANPATGWYGIGFENSGSDDTLAYCIFTDCKAIGEYPPNYYGGVIYVRECSLNILHSRFTGNQGKKGGAIYGESAYVIISSSRFEENSGTHGGALYLWESSAIVTNTLFCKNNAARTGGAIHIYQSPCAFVNVTITQNAASKGCGGISIDYTRFAAFRNCILWANWAPHAANLSGYSSNVVEFNYSDVDNIHPNSIEFNTDPYNPVPTELRWGAGNIAKDPLFTAAEKKDFSLQTNSPCIDAGDPDSLYFDLEDANNPNLPQWPATGSRRNDMGAYGGIQKPANTFEVALSVFPDSLDFGNIDPNMTKELTLHLTNNTPGTIHITDIVCSDPNHFSTLYFSEGNNQIEEIILESGAADSIQVIFKSDLVLYDIYYSYVIISTLECKDRAVFITAGKASGTHVAGGEVSGIWTKEKGSYNVYGDITVPSGKSLIIESGVTVRFMGKYGLTVGANAQLKALGTAADSIRFLPMDPLSGWYGIHLYNSHNDDTLSHCVITGGKDLDAEWESTQRGAVTINGSSPIIMHSRISENQALWGGAIYCYNSSAKIMHCRIDQNTGNWGGAMYCNRSSIMVSHCRFENNVGNSCGALLITWESSVNISNTLFCKNRSEGSGGAIACYNRSTAVFINVTISNNRSDWDGGGISLSHGADLTFKNSILWANEAQCGSLLYFSSSIGSTVRFIYSDIDKTSQWLYEDYPGNANIIWSIGNIVQDPLFTDSKNNDYTLKTESPCIDAGNPNPDYNDPEDPNNPGYALWPAMGTCRNDMGAYGGGKESQLVDVNPDRDNSTFPRHFVLFQNYPNPFNPETTIHYQLPKDGKVIIVIYNMMGQEIRRLVDEKKKAGYYEVMWDGRDRAGNIQGTGMYFVYMQAGSFTQTRKILLLK